MCSADCKEVCLSDNSRSDPESLEGRYLQVQDGCPAVHRLDFSLAKTLTVGPTFLHLIGVDPTKIGACESFADVLSLIKRARRLSDIAQLRSGKCGWHFCQ